MRECPSLLGRSTLTYEIRYKNDTLVIRLISNTGNGVFTKDWFPVLGADFKGKSSNTAGFVRAALVHECVIQASKDGGYGLVPPAKLKKTLKALKEEALLHDN